VLLGVGYRATIVCKLGLLPRSNAAKSGPASEAFGVGHNPDALSEMRSAGVGCTDDSPSRIKPHLGQVSEYTTKPSRSEHWRVLHERESWSYFANDSGHFHPESGFLTFDPCTLAGRADVLAGKAARNDINTSLPRSSVKGFNVRPNGEWLEKSIVLSLDKNGRGEGIKLNGANGSPSEELPPEYSSTSAREKSQLIHALEPRSRERRITAIPP
jgi:hypothetical protein